MNTNTNNTNNTNNMNTNNIREICIASDHAGFDLKALIYKNLNIFQWVSEYFSVIKGGQKV